MGLEEHATILFSHVDKTYPGGNYALRDLNLSVLSGQLVCLIGPSGCGKTTTLRLINRLVEPSRGTIRVRGEDIQKLNPVALRRSIGYVIQDIGLLPHMTILENIELVPRLLGWDRKKRRERALELMEMVGLSPDEYAHRYPRELSGGQQQRVGVMRALAAEPDIILMDEPFGALDPLTRQKLQDELKKLQNRLKKTIVFVTHDMPEALKLADRIIIMKDGRIHQEGTPEEILRHPKDAFVTQFLGGNGQGPQTVADLMKEEAVTVRPGQGVAEAVAIMRRHRVNALLVVEGSQYLGVVTAAGLRRAAKETKRLADLMEDHPAVEPEEPLETALRLMLEEHLDLLPVVGKDRQLVGIVTPSSVVDALAFLIPQGANGEEPGL
ncbi:MAG: betaine/proline/choline family ABC transporter ATP-binding protein [Bacillota bacterium]|nr:betaine/proline/choline family ABC transporter ATP-binding protein [Bacillota bacterium]